MTQVDNALGRKPLLQPVEGGAAGGGGKGQQEEQLFGYGMAMGPFEMAGMEQLFGWLIELKKERERERGKEKLLRK